MEKNYEKYEAFSAFNLVINKSNFDVLKSLMLDTNKYFTACQFTLDEKDKGDKKLYDTLQNAKKANWSYITNVGDQVLAQTGDESAPKIPYTSNLSLLFETPREELFSIALKKSQKVIHTLKNRLDGHITRKGVLAKGKVSIPANIALGEEEQVKVALEDLYNYFVSNLDTSKENLIVELDDSKEM